MARGSQAKQEVVEILQQAFGKDWIGEQGGKFYVWANENGEKLQIAIALTCPKTFVEAAIPASNKLDFSSATPVSAPPAEITEEEKKRLEDLMKKLGL